MDEKTWLGTLAEAKATAALIQQGFTVFTSASGKAPFDLIAYQDGRMYRIEVKGTSGASPTPYGSIEVKISTTRSNRTTNTHRRFDASKSDILAVYVHSFDAVCFFPSRLLDGRRSLSLRTVPNRTRNRLTSRLVADHTLVPEIAEASESDDSRSDSAEQILDVRAAGVESVSPTAD